MPAVVINSLDVAGDKNAPSFLENQLPAVTSRLKWWTDTSFIDQRTNRVSDFPGFPEIYVPMATYFDPCTLKIE